MNRIAILNVPNIESNHEEVSLFLNLVLISFTINGGTFTSLGKFFYNNLEIIHELSFDGDYEYSLHRKMNEFISDTTIYNITYMGIEEETNLIIPRIHSSSMVHPPIFKITRDDFIGITNPEEIKYIYDDLNGNYYLRNYIDMRDENIFTTSGSNFTFLKQSADIKTYNAEAERESFKNTRKVQIQPRNNFEILGMPRKFNEMDNLVKINNIKNSGKIHIEYPIEEKLKIGTENMPLFVTKNQKIEDSSSLFSVSSTVFPDPPSTVLTYESDSNWLPIGTTTNPFTGAFDGGGYAILNSAIIIGNSSIWQNENKAALFAVCSQDSLIKDLHVWNPQRSWDLYHAPSNLMSAGIAGISYGRIVNCLVDLQPGGHGGINTRTTGGLIAAKANYIEKCTADLLVAGVTNNMVIGGLVGEVLTNGIVKDCYYTHDVIKNNADLYLGGIIGGLIGINRGLVKNSYTRGRMGKYLQGSNVWYYMEPADGDYVEGSIALNYGIVQSTYYNTDTISPSINNSPYGDAKTTLQLQDPATYVNWDFYLRWKMENIDYENQAYFLLDWTPISSIDDLLLIKEFDYMHDWIKQQAPFDFKDIVDWQPIQGLYFFSGRYDSDFNRIFNFTLNTISDYNGLFYRLKDAYILNVDMQGSITGTNNYNGLIAGHSERSFFNNCKIKGNITGVNYSGGLVGVDINSKFFKCWFDGQVTNSGLYTGGLIGQATLGSYDTNYAKGAVIGDSIVGGLIGSLENATMRNCYSRGTCEAKNLTQELKLGGLIGSSNNNEIRYVYAADPLILGHLDELTVGGLIGQDTESILYNTYFDLELAGIDNGIGYARTTNEMTYLHDENTTYLQWNFIDLWLIQASFNDGYPFFIDEERMPYNIFAKINNIWTPILQVWAKINGVWKLIDTDNNQNI